MRATQGGTVERCAVPWRSTGYCLRAAVRGDPVNARRGLFLRHQHSRHGLEHRYVELLSTIRAA